MSKETTKTPEELVNDPGLDESIKNLTQDRITSTIMNVLNNECGGKLKVYLNTCVHCGLCSDACHTYLSRDKDPDFSPVGKVKNTIWEMVKKKGKVDAEFIKKAARIAFTECAVCRRCSMYCPFGIDIAYLLLVVRRICNLLGVVPQYLQDTTNSHAATMNQMWVQADEWIDTLQWQEDEACLEVPGVRIPIDKRVLKSCTRSSRPSPRSSPSSLGTWP